jgi:argininosuccinate lyase
MSEKIWSGRFSKATESLMEQYSYSLRFDQKLFVDDIAVNKAWAEALVEVGVYTTAEAARVVGALDDIFLSFQAGQLQFSPLDEDIHSANERWLTEKLGDLGARIHTGRSRNDQVVTDLRLYVRRWLHRLMDGLTNAQTTLLGIAQNHITTVMPGYTHLRQAQPLSFAHYLLALFFQLQRDGDRLRQALQRCNIMPLGSGALAGAAFAINRHKLAGRLGFAAPSENSIDATSDRDLYCEVVYICSQIMLHLSRIAEDFIIWSSEGCKFIGIDDAYATGSSMMPQKKNPDSLELIRGKTARVIGDQMTLMTLMKGIPTAYVRDLQEDKEALFDALEQTLMSVQVFDGVIRTLQVHADTMRSALDPLLYATDMADFLVRKGLPFRKAHSVVGQAVRLCEEQGIALSATPLSDLQKLSPLFDATVKELFDPISSINKRNLYGGTGVDAVLQQIKLAQHMLEQSTH